MTGVLRDPRRSTALLFAGLLAVGGTSIVLAYRGAADTLFVALQLPFLVSGGFAGIATVGAGLALVAIHSERVEAADERQSLMELQREALMLLAIASRTRGFHRASQLSPKA